MVDSSKDIPRWKYYPRQYGGLLLGTASVVGTAATYEQFDPYMIHKMLGWLVVGILAAIIHEFRPFQVRSQPVAMPHVFQRLDPPQQDLLSSVVFSSSP